MMIFKHKFLIVVLFQLFTSLVLAVDDIDTKDNISPVLELIKSNEQSPEIQGSKTSDAGAVHKNLAISTAARTPSGAEVQKESANAAQNVDNETSDNECVDGSDKKVLQGGWYLWEPYQFNRLTPGGYSLVGMDIELLKNIASRVGVSVNNEPVGWKKHQEDLRDGTRDIASGAT
jgi:hypothetical protein